MFSFKNGLTEDVLPSLVGFRMCQAPSHLSLGRFLFEKSR